jgi:hypothetical protein
MSIDFTTDYINENLLDFVKTFNIKKGKYFSTSQTSIFGMNFNLPYINYTTKYLISFLGNFDENCLYQNRGIDKLNINNFYGVTLSITGKSNACLGWRCLDGKNLQLVTFIHENGERMEENILITITPNQWFSCRMIIKDDRIIYNAKYDDKTAMVSHRINTKSSWLKRVLYPSFTYKAPDKDMTIKILEK